MRISFLNTLIKSLLLPLVLFLCLQSRHAEALAETPRSWTAGVWQQIDFFNSDLYDPQYQTTISLTRVIRRSTYSVRATQGYRFGQTGTQFVFETYPVFNDRFYGFAEYAWSGSDIFPTHRLGAEVFAALPRRFEASLGFRYFDFSGEVRTLLLTGSLSYYYRQYLFTVRPFISFSDPGSGGTLLLTARRFFGERGNSLTLMAGIGNTTDRAFFQLGGGEVLENLIFLNHQQLMLMGEYHLTRRWYLNGQAGIKRQELSFDSGNYVLNFTLLAGVNYRFNTRINRNRN
jgi:YaiO family outer membrane protein